MTRKIKKVTRNLKQQRDSLLQQYDTRQLHQLRVNIRRIRGLLKYDPSGKAKRLRKDWKTLVQQTNACRDWDTFVIYIQSTLTADQYDQLEPLLARQVRCSRKAVRRVLHSRLWEKTFQGWKSLLRNSGSRVFTPPALADSLQQVQQRVQQARWRALHWSDEASWHRFRIAIKELRYTLDNLHPQDPHETARLKTAIQRCRAIQDDLGEWHDTVVHRQLLAGIAGTGKGSEPSQVQEIVNSLGQKIRIKSDECLTRVQASLIADESLATTRPESVSPPSCGLVASQPETMEVPVD